MRIPFSDTTIVYVRESEHIVNVDGKKCRGAYCHTNDIYENSKNYTKMTYREFKEKYPIESKRYRWLRYIERKYN